METGYDWDRFESQTVWILGGPRTGSSWLLRLLIHPFKLASKEPTVMRSPKKLPNRPGPEVVPINEPYLPVHLTPLELPAYDPNADPDPSDFLLNSARAGDPSYVFADEYQDVWRPALRRFALERFRGQADRAATEHGLEDPMVAIKEPNGSHGAQFLMSLFPRARLLFLVRDGRDVIDSLLDAYRAGGWLAREGQDVEPEDWEARVQWVLKQSRLWVHRMDAVARAYEAHPPELRMTVRYEDLRADTPTHLKPIFDWMGLERSERDARDAAESLAFEAIPDEKKGSGTARRAATPGLWRENTNRIEQRIMSEVMGPKLAELGYPA